MLELATFYRRHFPLLREKCRRMLGDAAEAEDLAQETFVRLWKSAPDEQDPRAITSWIYRVSTRLAIDKIRERARKPRPTAVARDSDQSDESELDQLSSPLARTDDTMVARKQLERLAQSLPAQELEIALLHRLDGMTQLEIAEVLQISDRTVRRALSRLDERLPALREELSR